MSKRLLLMVLLVVIPGTVAFGWVRYQHARPPTGNTLSVVLISNENDSNTTSTTVYLYDTGDGSLDALGPGNTLSWSSSGRYLAAANAVESGYGASGRMTDFTIWDMDTGAAHWRRYPDGSQLSWSPEGDYLVIGALRYIGSHAYDGSLAVLAVTNTGVIEQFSISNDGPTMTGMSVGAAPLAWTSDNRLLIASGNPFASRNDPNGHFSLVDPASGAQEVVSVSDLPPTSDLPPLWPGIMTCVSPDGRLHASAVNSLNIVGIGTPSVSITDLETGITHDVHLPDSITLVQRIAWRPRSIP